MGDMMNETNDPWHQYRNIIGVPSRRRIFCGVGWIVCVLSLIIIAFAFMSKKDNMVKKIVNTAGNESSVQSYASFPSALNVSVDPCADFYTFTCGSWSLNNPIPSYDSRVTTFSILQDIVNKKKQNIFETSKFDKGLPRVVNNAIHFYNICIERSADNSSIQLLLEYINHIGGWPILNKADWNETSFDWMEASAFLIKYLDIHTIIGVYSIDSDKSGGRNVLYLKQPSILDDKDDMLSNMASLQMLYVILNILKGSNLDLAAADDIENLRLVDSKWRQLLSFPQEISDPMFMSVKELSEEIPDINWLQYLQLITNDTLHEINMTVTLNDTIVIDNLDFVKKVAEILSTNIFSKLELANLIGWFVVKDMWILIPDVLESYGLLNAYSKDDMKRALTSHCYDLVVESFPQSLDYLYVKYSSHVEIEANRVLTSYLKSAFKDILEKSNWLDDKTRMSVLYRLSSMRDIIGFPDYLNNKTKFDKLFENFPLKTDNILLYFIKIQQFFVKTRILHLKIPISTLYCILPRTLSDVSAYYIVNKNTLVYPLSLHNPPFYYFNGPWYLNFGAVGSVIGHEMMHGFDNIGNHGNDLNVTWFSNTTRKFYHEYADCFKYQYDAYDITGIYRNNATRTLRENIADNEGLHIAYDAYKKYEKNVGHEEKYHTLDDYTPEQMFFIAYGSVWCSHISPLLRKEMLKGSHSFPELRVNGAVSNSKPFAVAFNCPKGSPMNPIKKCSIW